MTDGEHRMTDNGIPYFEKDGVRLFVSSVSARLADEGETFEEYRLRRSMADRLLKRFKKGRLSWDPYPFEGMKKGLVNTVDNREAMEAFIAQYMKRNEGEIEGSDPDGV